MKCIPITCNSTSNNSHLLSCKWQLDTEAPTSHMECRCWPWPHDDHPKASMGQLLIMAYNTQCLYWRRKKNLLWSLCGSSEASDGNWASIGGQNCFRLKNFIKFSKDALLESLILWNALNHHIHIPHVWQWGCCPHSSHCCICFFLQSLTISPTLTITCRIQKVTPIAESKSQFQTKPPDSRSQQNSNLFHYGFVMRF